VKRSESVKNREFRKDIAPMVVPIEVSVKQIDQVILPPLIRRIVREVAEENELENFQFVQNREYDPASAPLFHYIGRSDAKIYMSGSDTYLSIADGTLDFFPIATRVGKEQIAPNECWIIESGRVEDIQDVDTDENTGEEHYLTVYQCFDVTQTL
jgi:hypothetical protein